MTRLFAACLAPLALMLAPAPAAQAGEIWLDFENPWVRAHPGGRDVTAGYVTITLGEDDWPDRLIGAEIEGGRIELHTHEMDDNGVMRMRRIDASPEFSHENPLVLAPGGMHLMIYDHPRLEEGDEVRITLRFEYFGEIQVTFPVLNRAPGGGHHHH